MNNNILRKGTGGAGVYGPHAKRWSASGKHGHRHRDGGAVATAFGTRVETSSAVTAPDPPDGVRAPVAPASPRRGRQHRQNRANDHLRQFLRERRLAVRRSGEGVHADVVVVADPPPAWRQLKANAAADLGAMLGGGDTATGDDEAAGVRDAVVGARGAREHVGAGGFKMFSAAVAEGVHRYANRGEASEATVWTRVSADLAADVAAPSTSRDLPEALTPLTEHASRRRPRGTDQVITSPPAAPPLGLEPAQPKAQQASGREREGNLLGAPAEPPALPTPAEPPALPPARLAVWDSLEDAPACGARGRPCATQPRVVEDAEDAAGGRTSSFSFGGAAVNADELAARMLGPAWRPPSNPKEETVGVASSSPSDAAEAEVEEEVEVEVRAVMAAAAGAIEATDEPLEPSPATSQPRDRARLDESLARTGLDAEEGSMWWERECERLPVLKGDAAAAAAAASRSAAVAAVEAVVAAVAGSSADVAHPRTSAVDPLAAYASALAANADAIDAVAAAPPGHSAPGLMATAGERAFAATFRSGKEAPSLPAPTAPMPMTYEAREVARRQMTRAPAEQEKREKAEKETEYTIEAAAESAAALAAAAAAAAAELQAQAEAEAHAETARAMARAEARAMDIAAAEARAHVAAKAAAEALISPEASEASAAAPPHDHPPPQPQGQGTARGSDASSIRTPAAAAEAPLTLEGSYAAAADAAENRRRRDLARQKRINVAGASHATRARRHEAAEGSIRRVHVAGDAAVHAASAAYAAAHPGRSIFAPPSVVAHATRPVTNGAPLAPRANHPVPTPQIYRPEQWHHHVARDGHMSYTCREQDRPGATPQLSPSTPRPRGPKRVTAFGRLASPNGETPAQRHGKQKNVRFAETREAMAVQELLGGGAPGRRPLGERFVNRMVGAGGAPTSLSIEEAKLLASLRKLDAHCLEIPGAVAGWSDLRGGSALAGVDCDGGSRIVDGLIDHVRTSGAYGSRRSVEEAALLASLQRLDGALECLKGHPLVGSALAGQEGECTRVPVAAPPQRQASRPGPVADAWGAPTGGTGGVSGRHVATGMKKRHERLTVGYTAEATPSGERPKRSPQLSAGRQLRSTAAAGRGAGEVLRAREHVRDSGGTIRGNVHDYF